MRDAGVCAASLADSSGRLQPARARDGSYDRVLRDNVSTQGAVRYVLEYPVRKGMGEHSREYAFVGSSRFGLRELLEFAYTASVADHRERAG
jgi:hypothetical protein